MEFDKLRVYTALNADELKVGSKVIVADNLSSLRTNCEKDWVFTLEKIWGPSNTDRFEVRTGGRFNLCYLVSEPEEKKMTPLEERAKEFVSKIASGPVQEMDYYANLLVGFVDETTENLKIELATSEHNREHNEYELVETYEKISGLEKENAELKEQTEEMKNKCSTLLDKLYLSGLKPNQIALVERMQDILGV